MFFIGFIAFVVLCITKLMGKIYITDSPYFYIALTTMLMGTQLFLAGFLGDLISRNSSGRNEYQIDKSLGV